MRPNKPDELPITDAWKNYTNGINYNTKLGLYNTVDRNYRFYIGQQWQGVKSNGLPTPVFNVLRRVLDYFISAISAEPLTLRIEKLDKEDTEFIRATNASFRNAWKRNKMNDINRQALRDAGITGTAIAYTYWNPDINGGESEGISVKLDEQGEPISNSVGDPEYEQVDIKGDFCTELVDATNLFLENPNVGFVNKMGKPYQRWIIISARSGIEELKERAELYGGEPDQIVCDNDNTYSAGDKSKVEMDDADRATYLLKFRYNKETNTIWVGEYTRNATIRPDYDTGLKLYPVAIMNWVPDKNTWLGGSIVTEMIPNQVIINKIHAILARWIMESAFGKIAYDKTKISSWSNAVGQAIPILGSPRDAVQQFLPAQVNPIVTQFFDMTLQKTLEMLGVTDAMFGDVRPENAAAIIALQRASAIPLENIKSQLHRFVEDIGLIWFDFMQSKYDHVRQVRYQQNKQPRMDLLDMNEKPSITNISVEAGVSSHWSEVASIETLGNLLERNLITFTQYLDRIPNGYLEKQADLIEDVKNSPPPHDVEMQQAVLALQQAQQAQQAPQAPQAPQAQQAPPMPQTPIVQSEGMMEPPKDYIPDDTGNLVNAFQQLPPEQQSRLMEMNPDERFQILTNLINQ